METLSSKIQDETLFVSGLKNSDPKIFEQLYNRFSAALFGVLLNWMKDREVAENLLQDVFVKA